MTGNGREAVTASAHGSRWIIGLFVLGFLVLRFGNDAMRVVESRRPSVSHGTPASGSLEHGKRLPTSGPNYRAYSLLGALLGRNSVNSRVRATVIDAYAAVAQTLPDVQWVYGETGWPRGGRFPPHKTHQNGLSVDFMVPVRDLAGDPARLPTWPWRRFGYALEFDSTGRGTGSIRGVVIDFPAIAAHLLALADATPRHGLAIDVVIFAPELERRLLAAPGGDQLRGRVRFTRRPPWVRHDEHYHVNFRVLPKGGSLAPSAKALSVPNAVSRGRFLDPSV